MSVEFPEGGTVYMKTEKGEVRIGSAVVASIAELSTREVVVHHLCGAAATLNMEMSDADVQKLIDHCQNKERRYVYREPTPRPSNWLGRIMSQAQPHKRDTNRKANKQARVSRRRNRK